MLAYLEVEDSVEVSTAVFAVCVACAVVFAACVVVAPSVWREDAT